MVLSEFDRLAGGGVLVTPGSSEVRDFRGVHTIAEELSYPMVVVSIVLASFLMFDNLPIMEAPGAQNPSYLSSRDSVSSEL